MSASLRTGTNFLINSSYLFEKVEVFHKAPLKTLRWFSVGHSPEENINNKTSSAPRGAFRLREYRSRSRNASNDASTALLKPDTGQPQFTVRPVTKFYSLIIGFAVWGVNAETLGPKGAP
jgi:hypothetical protein